MKQKGFTINEMLAVVALIAIAATVLLLSAGASIDRQVRKEAMQLQKLFRKYANLSIALSKTFTVNRTETGFAVVDENGQVMESIQCAVASIEGPDSLSISAGMIQDAEYVFKGKNITCRVKIENANITVETE